MLVHKDNVYKTLRTASEIRRHLANGYVEVKPEDLSFSPDDTVPVDDAISVNAPAPEETPSLEEMCAEIIAPEEKRTGKRKRQEVE